LCYLKRAVSFGVSAKRTIVDFRRLPAAVGHNELETHLEQLGEEDKIVSVDGRVAGHWLITEAHVHFCVGIVVEQRRGLSGASGLLRGGALARRLVLSAFAVFVVNEKHSIDLEGPC
jgi:hypothetical protein